MMGIDFDPFTMIAVFVRGSTIAYLMYVQVRNTSWQKTSSTRSELFMRSFNGIAGLVCT